MGNETKTGKIVEKVNLVYGTAIERTVEYIEQRDINVEKDIDVAKSTSGVIIDATGVIIDAVADHVSGLVNGEKLNLEKEKNRTIETIDKVLEKADDYYGMIADRVVEKMEQREQNIEKDIETGKQLVNELKSNS